MVDRVLTAIVGDEARDLLPATFAALDVAGYRVTDHVVSGRALLASVRRTEPDVVVLDLAIAGELGGTLIPQLLTGSSAHLIVFAPLVTPPSVDLARIRVVDSQDPRQLSAVCRQIRVLIESRDQPTPPP